MSARHSGDLSRAVLVRMIGDLRAMLHRAPLDLGAERVLAETTFDVSPEDEHEPDRNAPPSCPSRHRLSVDRDGKNVVLKICGLDEDGRPQDYDVYLRVGTYPDGQPGEVFASMGKIGGRVGALLDAWCTALSLMLQYGVPLQVIVDKFKGWQFEPAGYMRNRSDDVREVFASTGGKARSPIDAIVRWLEHRFGGRGIGEMEP